LEKANGKKYAILRHINSQTNCVFIVKYINKFGEQGGLDFLLSVIDKKREVG